MPVHGDPGNQIGQFSVATPIPNVKTVNYRKLLLRTRTAPANYIFTPMKESSCEDLSDVIHGMNTATYRWIRSWPRALFGPSSGRGRTDRTRGANAYKLTVAW